MNDKSFIEAFSCQSGSPMNPRYKCHLFQQTNYTIPPTTNAPTTTSKSTTTTTTTTAKPTTTTTTTTAKPTTTTTTTAKPTTTTTTTAKPTTTTTTTAKPSTSTTTPKPRTTTTVSPTTTTTILTTTSTPDASIQTTTEQETPSTTEFNPFNPDPETEPQICQSGFCYSLAYSVYSRLDLFADPCEDFYQHACGGWVSGRNTLMELNLYNKSRNSITEDVRYDFRENLLGNITSISYIII